MRSERQTHSTYPFRAREPQELFHCLQQSNKSEKKQELQHEKVATSLSEKNVSRKRVTRAWPVSKTLPQGFLFYIPQANHFEIPAAIDFQTQHEMGYRLSIWGQVKTTTTKTNKQKCFSSSPALFLVHPHLPHATKTQKQNKSESFIFISCKNIPK